MVVVGGADTDFIVRAPALPMPGGSVQGDVFLESPGGKGVNQTVGAARLGGRAALLACVGADARGAAIVECLRQEGIEAGHVARERGAQTGVTLIAVDARGRKQTANFPGANRRFSVAHVRRAAPVLQSTSVLVEQLEPPLDVVYAAAELARAAGARVVLDAGPATRIPDDLLRLAHIVRSNAIEAEALTGVRPSDRASARRAAQSLLARGAEAASIEAEDGGDFLVWRGGECWLPRLPVQAVDTTGAGDAFTAALAVAIAEGRAFDEAGRFANAAAALATTRLGALRSQPRRDEVERLLRTAPIPARA